MSSRVPSVLWWLGPEGRDTREPAGSRCRITATITSLLTGQGKDAPGGAYDYLVRGKMMGGFGVVAYPAQYGSSGIMTFIVNHDGVVYQKDLGPKTASVAQSMTKFNPDKTWTAVK